MYFTQLSSIYKWELAMFNSIQSYVLENIYSTSLTNVYLELKVAAIHHK